MSNSGYSTNEKEELRNLHVHEIEEYGNKAFLITLKGLSLKCKDCHSLQHIGRSLSVMDEVGKEKMKQHFMKVNDCTANDFDKYLSDVKQFKAKEHLKYQKMVIDPDYDPFMYRIEGEIPYKDKVVNELTTKDIYKYYQYDFDSNQEYTKFINRNMFKKKAEVIKMIKVYQHKGTWKVECNGKIKMDSMWKKKAVAHAHRLQGENPEAILEIHNVSKDITIYE